MPILTPSERLGTVVDGKYRLDRILGEGGFGVVYAGTHLRLDRQVAVKFLHPQHSQNADVVERFMREARATSKLSHPNVIDVRDVEMAPDGSVYMVLELLQGQPLSDYLAKHHRLPLAEVMALLRPVIDALEVAHRAGIVHRDIKPDNVFLSRSLEGRVVPKVLDFGIAKLADGNAKATATGSVIGTPIYMSPEQAMGQQKNVGPWSDVWSTAVMIYECLAGQFPFELPPEPTPTAVVLAVVTAPVFPLSNYRPDLPPAVSDVIGRALDRSVETRIRSMGELGTALDAACGQVAMAPGRISASAIADTALALATPISQQSTPLVGTMPPTQPRASHPAPTPAPSQVASFIANAPPSGPPPTKNNPVVLGLGLIGALAVLGLAGLGLSSLARPTTAPEPPPPAASTTASTTVSPPASATDAPPTTPSIEPPTTPLAEIADAGVAAETSEARSASHHVSPRVPRGIEPPPTVTTAQSATRAQSAAHARPLVVGGHEAPEAAVGPAHAPPPSVAPPASTAPTPEHRAGSVSLDQF